MQILIRLIVLLFQLTQIFSTVFTTIRNSINAVLSPNDVEPTVSSPPNTRRESRKTQMPETRVGLASTDGELIVFARKYLEIVGLVFFVWLLGKLRKQPLKEFLFLSRQRSYTLTFMFTCFIV